MGQWDRLEVGQSNEMGIGQQDVTEMGQRADEDRTESRMRIGQ